LQWILKRPGNQLVSEQAAEAVDGRPKLSDRHSHVGKTPLHRRQINDGADRFNTPLALLR
jgi:hypothetical protein